MQRKKISPIGIIYAGCSVVFLLLCTLSFFSPFPQRAARSAEEQYLCVWENGEQTAESYYSAFLSLAGYENGNVLLEREGLTGRVCAERALPYEDVLREGQLNDLLVLDCSPLDPLERAALGHGYARTLYYSDGEYFAFTGTRVQPTSRREGEMLVLLSGEPTAAEIAATGARKLVLHGACLLSGKALRSTSVVEIAAFAPYSVRNGALYRDTVSGMRLVAALPCATLTVEGNAFADEGALLPCTSLCALTLPFCGSDASGAGGEYRGELAHLFSNNGQYAVPDTLVSIRITGGRLISHAFYACGTVEEIDCCGLDPHDIDENAFADCASLKTLHSPRAGVNLLFGDYTVSKLACGCTLYERITE